MSKLNKNFRAKASEGFSPEPVKPQEVTDIFFIQEDEEVKLVKLEKINAYHCEDCDDPYMDYPCGSCMIAEIIDQLWNKKVF